MEILRLGNSLLLSLYLKQAVGIQRSAGDCRDLAPVGSIAGVGHPHVHHLRVKQFHHKIFVCLLE